MSYPYTAAGKGVWHSGRDPGQVTAGRKCQNVPRLLLRHHEQSCSDQRRPPASSGEVTKPLATPILTPSALHVPPHGDLIYVRILNPFRAYTPTFEKCLVSVVFEFPDV